jgi:hypothetical protein
MHSILLPPTLWENDTIIMPPTLTDALKAELETRGLFNQACENAPNRHEIFGGETAEESLNHFADRFKNSATRVAYVLLDPHANFNALSINLLASLFDGNVAILDIPCGSGGGLHGLLSCIYELRLHRVIPRTPSWVSILGGDCSETARDIYSSMLRRVEKPYSLVGLHLKWEKVEWDATDPFSTARLLDLWLTQTSSCEEHIVFVSAFSGFAKHHFETLSQSVEQVVVRPHDKMYQLIWIEPAINESNWLMPKLYQIFSRIFKGKNVNETYNNHPVEFWYRHPFTNHRILGKVLVIAFERKQWL